MCSLDGQLRELPSVPKRLCDSALNLRLKGSCHIAFMLLTYQLFTDNVGENQQVLLSFGIQIPLKQELLTEMWVCGRRGSCRLLSGICGFFTKQMTKNVFRSV